MNPLVGAAVVGGAANLVGNVTNQMFARRNARINYEYAEKSAENQYKRQVDFWNMQNEYNDPSAARARMEDAGINPTTDMGSGINAAGSGSTVPGNEYAQSGMMPVVPTNWSGFAQEVANIYNTAMNGNRAVKEAAKLEMEAKLLSLKGSGQELDNDLKEFKNQIEYMFAEDNALYDHWIKQNEHEKSLYDIQNAGKTGKLIDAQTANTNAGTERMNTLTPVEKFDIEQRIAESKIRIGQIQQSIVESKHQIYRLDSEVRNLDADTRIKLARAPLEESLLKFKNDFGIDLHLLPGGAATSIMHVYRQFLSGTRRPWSGSDGSTHYRVTTAQDVFQEIEEQLQYIEDAVEINGYIPLSWSEHYGVGPINSTNSGSSAWKP